MTHFKSFVRTTKKDRVAGVLAGLSAGDKNGGPQRLSILLSDHLLHQINHQSLNELILWNNYYEKWFIKGGYDTGSAFVNIFKIMKQQKQSSKNNSDFLQKPSIIAQQLYVQTLAKKEIVSIGIGSAHRNSVLSMFPWFVIQSKNTNMNSNENILNAINSKSENANLAMIAREESSITHCASLSVYVCIAVNYLSRFLIIGHSWKKSLEMCSSHLKQCQILIINDSNNEISAVTEIIDNILANDEKYQSLNKFNMNGVLSRGGYAPQVFESALYFLNKYESFAQALKHSIIFAGNANYCPVLVGSIGGARYGYKEVVKCCYFKHRQNIKLVKKDAIYDCLKYHPISEEDGSEIECTVADYVCFLAKRISCLWTNDAVIEIEKM